MVNETANTSPYRHLEPLIVCRDQIGSYSVSIQIHNVVSDGLVQIYAFFFTAINNRKTCIKTLYSKQTTPLFLIERSFFVTSHHGSSSGVLKRVEVLQTSFGLWARDGARENFRSGGFSMNKVLLVRVFAREIVASADTGGKGAREEEVSAVGVPGDAT